MDVGEFQAIPGAVNQPDADDPDCGRATAKPNAERPVS